MRKLYNKIQQRIDELEKQLGEERLKQVDCYKGYIQYTPQMKSYASRLHYTIVGLEKAIEELKKIIE